MPKGSFSSTPFRFCRYRHWFQRYLRSNSKVVINRTDFWTFFVLPIFKLYLPNLEPRQVPKFRRATPPNCEVISAPLLNFKPIFDSPLKKVVRGAPAPCGGCASKTWSFSSARKNLWVQHLLGAEIWPSKNFWFWWVNISRVVSDVSGLKFTKFFLFNAELTVFDNAVYRLSICLCSSEIFALKVESCR